MKTKSIWKNVVLLAFGSILTLHMSVAKAQSTNTEDTSSSSGDEECVITEDGRA